MLATSARAHAALNGRAFVIPDDVTILVRPALGNRVLQGPAAELQGLQSDVVLREIIERVPAPR